MNSLAGLLVLACAAAQAVSPTYFVATNGNDAWSGTLAEPNAAGTDGPVASLHRAHELIRTHATADGLAEGGSVYVRGGTYYLRHPILISRYESGTERSPMLWQAYKFEEVTLVAGTLLTGWEGDAEGVRVAALPEDLRLDDAPVQVLHAGKRMPLARWPNVGENENPLTSYALVDVVDEDGHGFTVKASAPLPDADLEGYPARSALGDITALDTAKAHLSFDGNEAPRRGQRFFLEDSPPLLDVPGEWWLDRDEEKVHFFSPGEGETVLAHVPHHFVISEAHHVAVLGFRMVGAAGNAVKVQASSDCLVARNTITDPLEQGVSVQGGERNRVGGNDISGSGGAGIEVEGGGAAALRPSQHFVVNNHVQHSAAAGIVARGVGAKVAHNLVHDAASAGIEIEGNDHLVELNRLYDVCAGSAQVGAITVRGSWTKRGNIIRYNRIHDVLGFGLLEAKDTITYARPYMAWGVYLDNAASGTVVEGNLIYRVPLGGVVIAGGRDNTISNNVIVECVPALHIDARWPTYDWASLERELAAMNADEPPYSVRYPELAKMQHPRVPANNHFLRNVVAYKLDEYRGLAAMTNAPEAAVVYTLDKFDAATCRFDHNLFHHYGPPLRALWNSAERGTRVLSWEAWQAAGFDGESLSDDPLFLEASSDEYLMLNNSSAYPLGFERLPQAAMGLYQDEFRVSWPPPQVEPRPLPTHKTFTVN